jgi:hypothetical protein
LPLLSQHYLTRLPFPKRYGNRYEAESYGAIAPSPPYLALILVIPRAVVPA